MPMFIKKLLKTKFFTELIALTAALYLWLVRLTSIVKIQNANHLNFANEQNQPIIFAVWHGRIFYSVMICSSLYKYKNYSLVSKHRDGQTIAAFVRKFNSKTISGSSSDGGFAALKQILKILKSKKQRLCITPDGPRGPNMKINSAIIEIAARTNSIIIPLSYSAKYARFFNSWDKMLIPRLFNHITVNYGEPISVAKKISKTEIAQHKNKLEQKLNKMTKTLDKFYSHNQVESGSQNIKRV